MQSFNRWIRRSHRWLAILFFAPLLIVIITGLLLQIKKEWSWVQPPTQKGSAGQLLLGWEELLRIASSDPDADIQSWADIDRLDVRPQKGIVKVRAKNNWELQVDLANGQVLSSCYRRSDWIESLHDGSWFSDFAKLWIFLPNGIALFILWFTGLYLWYLPYRARAAKKKRLAS